MERAFRTFRTSTGRSKSALITSKAELASIVMNMLEAHCRREFGMSFDEMATLVRENHERVNGTRAETTRAGDLTPDVLQGMAVQARRTNEQLAQQAADASGFRAWSADWLHVWDQEFARLEAEDRRLKKPWTLPPDSPDFVRDQNSAVYNAASGESDRIKQAFGTGGSFSESERIKRVAREPEAAFDVPPVGKQRRRK